MRMFLESLFIVLLLLVFSVIFYRSAIHEYTIVQKNWGLEDEKWSALLGEKAPLIIRSVPATWTRLWTHKRTAKFGWPVVIQDAAAAAAAAGAGRSRTGWSTWLGTGVGTGKDKRVINEVDLATTAGLPEQAADIGYVFRAPYWLPGSLSVRGVRAGVIPPLDTAFVGLQKTTAEATCFIATDGRPLLLWLAHEGATQGGRYLPPNPYGRNPWTMLPEETPWISELKFLEIRLRPGNMLILPAHWWIAMKCDEVDAPAQVMAEGAWYWTTEFHSPISWLATRFHEGATS